MSGAFKGLFAYQSLGHIFMLLPMFACTGVLNVPNFLSLNEFEAQTSQEVYSQSNVDLVYENMPKNVKGYCILENDTDQTNCAWVTGSLPESYTSESGDGTKVLTIWTKNSRNVARGPFSTPPFVIDSTGPTWTAANLSHAATYSSLTSSPTVSFDRSAEDTYTAVRYQYAVGTSPTARTSVKAWTNLSGTASSFQISSLSLSEGTTYYVSMRAMDEANNISTVHTSSGWVASAMNLSYSGATGTSGTRGVAMSVSPTTLTAGGGAATITNCAVTAGGTLPTGLSLNTSTCVISGTPTSVLASNVFTITATNSSAHTKSATVNISVSEQWLDDSNVNVGFSGATKVGVTWSANKITLNADTDCDGNMAEGETIVTNCTELDASWTPEWANLVGYWKMNESSWNGTASEVSDSRSTNHGTSGGTMTTTSSAKIGSAAGNFDGVNDYVSIPLNLSATNKVTVAFWMNWTAFANDDDLAMEFTPDYNASLGGFIIDPNAGFPFLGQFAFGVRGDGGYNMAQITRPSAGEWHHYVLVFDKSSAGNESTIYVDGVLVTSTHVQTQDNTNNFGNSTLYLMSRGGASLFGAGKLDDLAIWSTDLDANEVLLIYKNQSPLYSGSLVSRVFDNISNSIWSGISWLTTLPFGKELPGDADNSGTITAADSETTAEYSAIATDTLMNGLEGLWHFNGTVGTIADSASLSDASGAGGDATIFDADGSNTIAYAPGKLGESIYFDGTNDYASAPVDLSGTNVVSVAFWLRWDAFSDNDDLAIEFTPDTNFTNDGFLINPNGGPPTPGAFQFSLYGNIGWSVGHVPRPSAKAWHHYVVIFDKSRASNELSIYIDGVEKTVTYHTNFDNTNNFGNSNLYFMSRNGSSLFGKGYLDEVALWSRALSQSEIEQLYRRGANRVKFQTRSCSASDCSDDPSWVGPDGTSSSYFSELHNNTTISASGSPTGRVKVSFTDLIFFDFSSVSHTSNPYFQYKFLLESDSLCDTDADGTADDPCYPDVRSVELSP